MPCESDPPLPPREPAAWTAITAGGALVAVVAAAYWALWATGLMDVLSDTAALRASVHELGFAGPVALIGLLAIAIVVSPIPSAPVAVVAGAVYGPLWGTVLVVIGAEAGAIAAFLIARFLGYEAIRRWSGPRKIIDMLAGDRSQWGLMLAVFVSRLLPFVSFDAVSYAAGLTPLAFWRFAAATFAGIIPVSFLLSYAGEALADTRPIILVVVVAVLAAAPVIALGLRALWRRIA